MKKTCLFLLLMTTSALAQEPSEAEKKRALMQAYITNSNIMFGWGSLDMSGLMQKDAIVAKTDKVQPVIKVEDWRQQNGVDAIAEVTHSASRSDICKRHGMRKVTHGDHWRCQK